MLVIMICFILDAVSAYGQRNYQDADIYSLQVKGKTYLFFEATTNSRDQSQKDTLMNLLAKEGASVLKWKKKLDKTGDALSGTALYTSCEDSNGETTCALDINPLLPDAVLGLTNRNEKQDLLYPNCYSGSLVASGLSLINEVVTDTNLNFWLNSSLCTEREATEALDVGDIGAVRQKSSKNGAEDMHSFVYISNNLIFEKENADQPYRFRRYTGEWPSRFIQTNRDRGFVTSGCNHVQGTPKDCSIWINYYQCKTFSSYLKNVTVSSELKTTLNRLRAIGNVTRPWTQTEINELAKIKVLAKSKLAKNTKNAEQIIWEGIVNMFNSDDLGLIDKLKKY